MSEFLIITGMSGAGRSSAADTFEDLGWFVIDNMPTALIAKVAELVDVPGSDIERIALVVGRAAGQYEELKPALDHMRQDGARVRMLFLDASDGVLVRRFENTRRRHPLSGDEGVSVGIARERELLDQVKADADVVIDTGALNVHQFRDRLIELFAREDSSAMRTSVVSFGYKHGTPSDADIVLDCRFLPNPHWVDELRPYCGLDEPVREYVIQQPETKEFLDKLDDLLGLLLPSFVKEGKSYLTIAVGCTGGQHRSVVLAEEIAGLLRTRGFDPVVSHRDVAA